MKTLLTETNILQTEQMCCTLRYALLEQPVEDCVRYAVSVWNQETGEQAQVLDLTSEPGRAADFFEKIVRGLVTPVTLLEVAEDFVAS